MLFIGKIFIKNEISHFFIQMKNQLSVVEADNIRH